MKSLLLALFLLSGARVYSQLADTTRTEEVKVFILCQWCYEDYLRTHITWVNFVRDRFDAEVQLIINNLSTGSGGQDYSIQFLGKGRFTGMVDTLHFTSNAINTEDEIRKGLAQVVSLGLIRYVAHTSMADFLKIESLREEDKDQKGIGTNPKEDPWNAWVFNTSLNGEFNGQRVSQSVFINTSLNANRTTEKMRFFLGFSNAYNEQRFDFNGEQSVFIRRNYSLTSQYVHSLNDRWSLGVIGNTGRSDFSNHDVFGGAQAAVEWNVFPYKEAQTKLITLTYSAGLNYFRFQDTTIFNQTEATVPVHRFNVGTAFTQKWGSLSGGMYASQFLNDPTKYRYGGWINFDVRIFRGLSVNAYMNYDAINDQINLRKGGASSEEVLLAQQELATNFSYYVWCGLNYRFGSIYNNVVNPRFNFSGL
jgi:hypothetical protein